MAFHNRVLSDKVEVESLETMIARQKQIDRSGELSDMAKENQWVQVVSQVAKLGLPENFADFETLFEPVEIGFRNELGTPSKRPEGKRSKGTGKTLPADIKTYKSVIKGAYDWSVELLDAAGVPRPLNAVRNDVAEAKPPKDPEEKVENAAQTFIKIHSACKDSDPRDAAAEATIV